MLSATMTLLMRQRSLPGSKQVSHCCIGPTALVIFLVEGTRRVIRFDD